MIEELPTTATALLSTGGVAAIVMVLVQFISKPVLRKRYKIAGSVAASPNADSYKAMMNVSSAIIGIAFALAAQFIVGSGVIGEKIIAGILVGIAGGYLGVGLAEQISNARAALKK